MSSKEVELFGVKKEYWEVNKEKQIENKNTLKEKAKQTLVSNVDIERSNWNEQNKECCVLETSTETKQIKRTRIFSVVR